MIIYTLSALIILSIFIITKKNKKIQFRKYFTAKNILLTDDTLNNGLANKIFNIIESMIVAYQTNRCLQCIVKA